MTVTQELTIDAALGTLAIAEMLSTHQVRAANRAVDSMPQTYLVAGFSLVVQLLVHRVAEETHETPRAVLESTRASLVDFSLENGAAAAA